MNMIVKGAVTWNYSYAVLWNGINSFSETLEIDLTMWQNYSRFLFFCFSLSLVLLNVFGLKCPFFFFIGTAQGWVQKRNGGQAHNWEGEQDVQQGLPAHGADVATSPEQNGVHSNGLGCVAGHHVQCAPPTRVHVQPRSREHAAGRWFAAVREGPVLIVTVLFLVSHFAPNHFGFPVALGEVGERGSISLWIYALVFGILCRVTWS